MRLVASLAMLCSGAAIGTVSAHDTQRPARHDAAQMHEVSQLKRSAMPSRLWTRVGHLAVNCRVEGLDAAASAMLCDRLAALVGEGAPYKVTRARPGAADVRIDLTGRISGDSSVPVIVAGLMASRPAIEGETDERSPMVDLRVPVDAGGHPSHDYSAQITAALTRILPWRRAGNRSQVDFLRQ